MARTSVTSSSKEKTTLDCCFVSHIHSFDTRFFSFLMNRSIGFLLLTFFVHSIDSFLFNRSALCFLTRKPTDEISEFAEQLAKTLHSNQIDTFIMIDDNQFDISSLNKTSSSLQYLQIANDLCVKYGYENTTSLGSGWSSITSWDKALLYFAVLNTNYSFVWFVEDDVFIPSVQSFLSLHLLYSNTTDLIVPRNALNLQGDTSTWLWSMALGFFPPPWSCSMVNLIGLSRLMLDTIDDYVQWRGRVPFHEFFFNTLALQQNLTIRTPVELNTIVYRSSYSYEQILKQPNHFWHPVKNLTQAKLWRQRLINDTLRNSSLLNITDLPNLCPFNETDEDFEEDLQGFFDEFNQIKSFYSRSDRLFLYEYFLSSYKECQKNNRSTNILSSLQQLADHAYRLPEASIDELTKEKSDEQRKFEEDLEKNQEQVLEILSQNETNRSLIVQLRKRAMILTRQLTREIQRQMNKKNSSQSTSSSSSSSSSTSSTSTVRTTTDPSTEIFDPISSTKYRTINQFSNRFSLILSRENHFSTNERTNSDLKIIFILFSLSFFTFLILCWKRVEERRYLIYVMIYLSFMSLCYLI